MERTKHQVIGAGGEALTFNDDMTGKWSVGETGTKVTV
jgi:uncharacterized cupin superfamily protein